MPDQTDIPSRRTTVRGRRASLPILTGSLIAAAGLVFGGIATASAHGSHTSPSASTHAASHGHQPFLKHTRPHPSLKRVANPPKNGNKIPNVSLVESEIENYYGSVAGTIGTDHRAVTLPSPKSNYAKQMHRIEAHAKAYFTKKLKRYERDNGRVLPPALVFDVDDTTLNTYDYTIFDQFGYDPTSNADFVNHADFPAVFGMPNFVNWAKKQGFTIFFLTGRPTTQRAGTVLNLKREGYNVPLNKKHVYLKYASLDQKPGYVHCTGPKDPTTGAKTCTTIDYKSSTRKHIQKQGFHILGDFGDQFSDLKGGAAGTQVKLPNPMYYLP